VARRYAFVEYDGPPLESLDLYTKKSGEEIVAQLYNFVDKGGREVALRPEMTPTLARMVAARANALRKPVRWFSLPQLFRYERQQKGRLREHFQLNVDIIGESDVTADAELLGVAIDIMREFGLSPEDVRARVSDRRLLRALLHRLGVSEQQQPAVFSVIDKIERQPRQLSAEKLEAAGMSGESREALFALMDGITLDALRVQYGDTPEIAERLADLERYYSYLEELGVSAWVQLDLSIVRGLAYYTGIVFELFDAQGEFRAICGGGRYDNLLNALGGVDLPALGFGMGDVVLGELLRSRGLADVPIGEPDFWIAAAENGDFRDVILAATQLRRAGASVEYALRAQTLSKQRKAAFSAGATYFLTVGAGLREHGTVEVEEVQHVEGAGGSLVDRLADMPKTLASILSLVRDS
jgi:histidyl-tRNA synthetase